MVGKGNPQIWEAREQNIWNILLYHWDELGKTIPLRWNSWCRWSPNNFLHTAVFISLCPERLPNYLFGTNPILYACVIRGLLNRRLARHFKSSSIRRIEMSLLTLSLTISLRRINWITLDHWEGLTHVCGDLREEGVEFSEKLQVWRRLIVSIVDVVYWGRGVLTCYFTVRYEVLLCDHVVDRSCIQNMIFNMEEFDNGPSMEVSCLWKYIGAIKNILLFLCVYQEPCWIRYSTQPNTCQFYGMEMYG